MNDDLRVHRAQEEMILILLPDLTGMRDPKKVELVVAGAAVATGGSAGERRGESHEIVTGRFAMLQDARLEELR
jgi:hypothetical protein